MGMYVKTGKVIFDKALCVSLFLLLGCPFLFILLLYAVSFDFPLFYKSVRVGKSGIPFTMFKFRTLKTDVNLDIKFRQFWLGKFLRTTNLDELPQILNILKGEMSLVGPRPLPVEYERLLSEDDKLRHSVHPGITGLAQVSGKNSLAWDKKFDLDIKYVHEISFGLDLRIIWRTIVMMVQMKRDISLEEKPLGQ